MSKKINLQHVISEPLADQRLDKVLTTLLPDYSRNQLQTWVASGKITINQKTAKKRTIVTIGDVIKICVTPTIKIECLPESIPLDILYEDAHLIILNKPAGLLVHPGAEKSNHTLVNALLYHDSSLEQLPRAGLIHRLDQYTTGAIVIAKTPIAYKQLSKQMQKRQIKRLYEAVVWGRLNEPNTIKKPIARHPNHRKKMATVKTGGRVATTHYRILKNFQHHTHIEVQLETGRTHQIRVHLSDAGYPIVGDPLYGGQRQPSKDVSDILSCAIQAFERQALHARTLELYHPQTGETICQDASLPDDLQTLLKELSKQEERITPIY